MNTTPVSSITSLENAQDLYNLDDSVHGLFVMLDDPYEAAAGERAIGKIAGR
jgi:ABC-type lipoprotein release transport system permease subunit